MRRVVLRAVGLVAALFVLLVALFALNGLVLAAGESPRAGTTRHLAALPRPDGDGFVTLRVVAYNVAKGFVHRGGLRFEPAETVRRNVLAMAAAVAPLRPDLLILSEVVQTCDASPVDQVATMADATGMHAWVFGENYNFGLPFYRIVGGNAVLARFPLTAVGNPSLAGRRPFWATRNSRRALFAEASPGGARVRLVALHNDSYDLRNNLRQTRQIVDLLGDVPALLAGDFNAQPHEPPMQWLRATGRFAGRFDGPATFPGDGQRLDYILAPAGWELVEERVIEADASDHRPVYARFRVRVR